MAITYGLSSSLLQRVGEYNSIFDPDGIGLESTFWCEKYTFCVFGIALNGILLTPALLCKRVPL